MSLFIKVFSMYNPIKFLAILYAKSLANLVAEVGTRHSHQILAFCPVFRLGNGCYCPCSPVIFQSPQQKGQHGQGN